MGAFLTHGGVNSMYESICAGVVNIFWPQSADQPLHAAYMSQIVRTGDGARPPARGGKVEGTSEAVAAEIEQVLADLVGSVGERKRKNLGVVRQKMLDDMKEGGVCDMALKGLLDLVPTNAPRC
ncbi:hypothetical protein FRB96_005325 [Tulasnella sp. 330]|nr:hypothetical protein FRB96_005325 [Tulasnella sp. 330]